MDLGDMRTGVLVGFLLVVGFACLMMADSARRGILLKERDRRVAELESELTEVRKKLDLEP